MRVDRKAQRANDPQQANGKAIPPPSARNWGTAHDFGQWERRANG